jgi:hypothetical protein
LMYFFNENNFGEYYVTSTGEFHKVYEWYENDKNQYT